MKLEKSIINQIEKDLSNVRTLDDSVLEKMLFLAYRDLSEKWTCVIKYWPKIIAQLPIAFNNRLILDL